jgi:NitT/TauT family transport system substrate-binding protein
VSDRSICIAPEYVAEELLRAEGFTDIRYVEAPGSQQVDALLQGELDFANFFPGGNIPQIDAGVPTGENLLGTQQAGYYRCNQQGRGGIADNRGRIRVHDLPPSWRLIGCAEKPGDHWTVTLTNAQRPR